MLFSWLPPNEWALWKKGLRLVNVRAYFDQVGVVEWMSLMEKRIETRHSPRLQRWKGENEWALWKKGLRPALFISSTIRSLLWMNEPYGKKDWDSRSPRRSSARRFEWMSLMEKRIETAWMATRKLWPPDAEWMSLMEKRIETEHIAHCNDVSFGENEWALWKKGLRLCHDELPSHLSIMEWMSLMEKRIETCHSSG